MQYDIENQKTKVKLQRKQNYYTTQMFPSSKKGNKPQAPLTSVQTRLGQEFGEDICELVLDVNMAQVYITLLIVVVQEMKADLYMFGFLVKNWVFGYAYGTGVVTKQRHSPKL